MKQYFKDEKWSLFFTDDESFSVQLNLDWWRELLPNLQVLPKGPLYRVQQLIIGTRGRCAHYGMFSFDRNILQAVFAYNLFLLCRTLFKQFVLP